MKRSSTAITTAQTTTEHGAQEISRQKTRAADSIRKSLIMLVRDAGFEPATSCV